MWNLWIVQLKHNLSALCHTLWYRAASVVWLLCVRHQTCYPELNTNHWNRHTIHFMCQLQTYCVRVHPALFSLFILSLIWHHAPQGSWHIWLGKPGRYPRKPELEQALYDWFSWQQKILVNYWLIRIYVLFRSFLKTIGKKIQEKSLKTFGCDS